jgi:hypothetical protein
MVVIAIGIVMQLVIAVMTKQCTVRFQQQHLCRLHRLQQQHVRVGLDRRLHHVLPQMLSMSNHLHIALLPHLLLITKTYQRHHSVMEMEVILALTLAILHRMPLHQTTSKARVKAIVVKVYRVWWDATVTAHAWSLAIAVMTKKNFVQKLKPCQLPRPQVQ